MAPPLDIEHTIAARKEKSKSTRDQVYTFPLGHIKHVVEEHIDLMAQRDHRVAEICTLIDGKYIFD